MNSHMIQLTNEHKGIENGTAPGNMVANQYQGICVKSVFG